MKIRTNIKSGKLAANHNERLKVKTSLRAGRLSANHNQAFAR